MNFREELSLLLRARIPVINIVGSEEARIIRVIEALAASPEWPAGEGLYSWDIADQFVCHREGNPRFDSSAQATPDTILTMIEGFKGGATFILKDFHHVWEIKKSIIRKLRNLSQKLTTASRRKNIIMITPEYKLPIELKDDVVYLECPKPDATEIDALIRRVFDDRMLHGVTAELRAKIVESALGLSSTQVERVFRMAAASGRDGRLDESCIDLISSEKCRIIRESGALEFLTATEKEGNIGGLDVLKGWLGQRAASFMEKARAYGLDAPRGLALIGIPGTGKSLCARLIAGMWKLPLLRLDMGAVFGGLVGLSEKNIREAIQISEVISPCILWVDEIEKAFAGSAGDSGTSARVLATFLTWMSEKRHPVFVFATANDIARLPPEFLRKGRFDEVFFLDLPSHEERRKILEVHLHKKGFTMVAQKFDLARIATATEGFVGAELEAIVKDAMFPAFMDNERELDTDDLLKSGNDMVPLAKSHAEVVIKLRALVTGGLARNASRVAVEKVVKLETIPGVRRLEI